MRETYTTAFLLLGISALQGTQPAPEGVVFENRTGHAGITFQLENHPTPGKYLIESITGGCAFVDYDGDGLLDIYLVNGAAIRPASGATPMLDKSDPRYWNRLYRNLGGGRFQDVTDAARVQGRGYGLGVATGDYDNDGYPDLYVTNYGGNELFHNQGDGTFREVSGSAGVRGGGFSTSAVFVDYDRDGLLDLYVARYVNWSFTNNIFCGVAGVRDYCHPKHFNGEPDLLFRNNGDGTFRDVSKEAGIHLPQGKGLGVAVADFNRDGWPDVFVANDSAPQFLLRNEGGKRFQDVGLESAAALNEHGSTFAGMGVDAADYDNDGWPDVFVTALSLEGYVLFRNEQDGMFADLSRATGVAKATFYLSGWGARFIDFDNDGWKDLFVANSHVMRDIESQTRTLSYEQPLLMLRNAGGRFADVGPTLGPMFSSRWAARGAAFGDYDNDGDTDILVQVLGRAPLLLENRGGNAQSWVGLRLRGKHSNRDGLGARIKVTKDRGGGSYFESTRGSSYLAGNDPRVLIGLGHAAAEKIEIWWPSGRVQTITRPPMRRYLDITEPD